LSVAWPGDTPASSVLAYTTLFRSSQSAITLSWSASTDNVGVTGYGRYLNGSLLSTGAGTSFGFTGLACGTSYTLAVDAVDAAGNRAAPAVSTAGAGPCPVESAACA